MTKVVVALVGGEAREAVAEQRPEGLDRSTPGRPQNGLQFGKAEFDGIEVGAIRGQVPEHGPGRLNERADASDVMRRQVVGHHDVAHVQRGDENLVDIGEEALAIHRAIQHTGGRETGDPEGGDEGARLPVALRGVIGDSLAPQAPPVPTQQLGRDATFIKKDEAAGIERRGVGLPRAAGGPDIRPVVFGRANRFF